MLVTHYSYDHFAAAADSLIPVQHIDGYLLINLKPEQDKRCSRLHRHTRTTQHLLFYLLDSRHNDSKSVKSVARSNDAGENLS